LAKLTKEQAYEDKPGRPELICPKCGAKYKFAVREYVAGKVRATVKFECPHCGESTQFVVWCEGKKTVEVRIVYMADSKTRKWAKVRELELSTEDVDVFITLIRCLKCGADIEKGSEVWEEISDL